MRLRMRSSAKYNILSKQSRQIFFGHSALGKNSEGYGIHSLPLTCHLLRLIFIHSELSVTSSELTALTNITSSVHSSHYIMHIFILLRFPSEQRTVWGKSFPKLSFNNIFKMAGTALICGFCDNTYSKTICSCLKTFGSYDFTLAFCKSCKPQQFHHLLPALDAFTSAFWSRLGLDFWRKSYGCSLLSQLCFPRQSCLRMHDVDSSQLLLNRRSTETIYQIHFICQWAFTMEPEIG